VDIAQTIKQRAQERGVDPELALAIAQAESRLRPQIKNPKSSAHGLFQIVDDTWKQYGGDPKKRKDVNENIRIGLEILADNQQALTATLGREPRPGELYAGHFFGTEGAKRVLTANPDAPVSSVVSARVLKANPELLQGKSVSQALFALSAKVGDTGPGQRVPRAPDPKTARPVYREDPAKPPVISNAIDATNQYGPGYQAALALSYLSDTQDESEDPDAPSIVERDARDEMLERQTEMAEASAAAATSGSRASGMLAEMDFGYAPVVGQQAPVKMADGGLLMQAASVVPISSAARKQYDEALGKWNAYSAQGESYNAALDKYNREVMTPYSAKVAAYNKAVDAWNAGPRTSPLTMAAPSPSRQFTMAAPKEPNTLSPEQMDALMLQAQKRRARTAQALNVAADPSQFGLSMPALFAEGGEVTDPEAALFAGRGDVPAKPSMTGRELAREAMYGVGDLPYVVAGAPVDLAAMAMAPFGYKDEKPFMGSADIKARMTRAGIRPPDTTDPRLMGPRTAAELLASLTNPAGVTRGAVKAVEKGTRGAGEAAKMLEDVTVGNIQRARVAKAGERAKNIPDTAYDPLRERLEAQGSLALAVRSRGTPFLLSQPDVDQPEYFARWMANTGDEALDKWSSTKIPAYLRRDYATPEDQFVKAAEEGKLLHFAKKPQDTRFVDTLSYGEREALKYVRPMEGFSPEGEAKTAYGKIVEDRIDSTMTPTQLSDLDSNLNMVPSHLRGIMATAPETRLSQIDADALSYQMQFRALRDSMLAMREMPPTVSAYGQPPVKVPQQFKLSDEVLRGLTPAQASNKVALFKRWQDETRQKMASQFVTKNPDVDRVRLDDEHTLVRFPDLDNVPQMRQLATDVGCDGGWCTQEEATALSYGSGDRRLQVLFDKNARPRVQISTIETPPPGTTASTDQFFLTMTPEQEAVFFRKYPDVRSWSYSDVASTPDYIEWSKTLPPAGIQRVTEIKGVRNATELDNLPFTPALQDYFRKLEAENPGIVFDELENVGLSQLPRGSSDLEEMLQRGQASGFLQQNIDLKKFQPAVEEEIRRLNNNSLLFSKDVEGSKQEEFAAMIKQAVRNTQDKYPFSTGFPGEFK
jgi:hypothetical protein